jgi:FMN reductase
MSRLELRCEPGGAGRSGQLLVVGIGGTTTVESSTERALNLAMARVEQAGARTRIFDGAFLARLAHYEPDAAKRSEEARTFVEAIRAANGLVVASPGYHGSISGLVKNALDYIEETAADRRTYLDGMPVGLIATAYGGQASASTLAALRSIVHALRGWPTPLGVCIDSSGGRFSAGEPVDPRIEQQLDLLAHQVVGAALALGPGAQPQGLPGSITSTTPITTAMGRAANVSRP